MNETAPMAGWEEVGMNITINKCQNKKCLERLDFVRAMGVVSLNVCRHCKRFYALKVVDVTKELNSSFKKKVLGSNPHSN